MASLVSGSHFNDLIGQALKETIDACVEDEIKAAQDRVRVAVQKAAATIAAGVLQHYTMERVGADLVIRVKIG